jgi:hypothetical protein
MNALWCMVCLHVYYPQEKREGLCDECEEFWNFKYNQRRRELDSNGQLVRSEVKGDFFYFPFMEDKKNAK